MDRNGIFTLAGWFCVIALNAALLSAETNPAAPASEEFKRWTVPQHIHSDYLPLLPAAPVLDGDLSDWRGMAVVPIRHVTDIAHRQKNHSWNGPADCSVVVFCGWHADGLFLAGNILDDDVQNEYTGDRLYEQDCMEIFIDGRVGDSFMRSPYCKGTYHIFIRPPLQDSDVMAAVRSDLGDIEGLQVAGQRQTNGWNFELKIPWSAFPDFTPKFGYKLGLQFGLGDYDERDKKSPQPLMLSARGITRLSHKPEHFAVWKLHNEDILWGLERPDLSLALAAPLTGQSDSAPWLPEQAREQGTRPSATDVVTTSELQAMLDFFMPDQIAPTQPQFTVTDWNGQTVVQQNVPWDVKPAGTLKNYQALFKCDLQDVPDGVYQLSAKVTFSSGNTSCSTRYLLVVAGMVRSNANLLAETILELEQADLASMAQQDPSRATAWLSVAACIETLKRAQHTMYYGKVDDTIAEIRTRLSLLKNKKLPDNTLPFHQLLQLAADPAAQVTVEYVYGVWSDKNPRLAGITFRHGMVPYAIALVREYPDAAAAKETFETMHTGDILHGQRHPSLTGLKDLAQNKKIDGIPCRVAEKRYSYEPMFITQTDPARQVVLYSITNRIAFIVDIEELDNIQPNAVTIVKPVAPALDSTLRQWAQHADIPIQSFAEAAQSDWGVLAGDVGSEPFNSLSQQIPFSVHLTIHEAGWDIHALAGSRIIRVPAASEVAAKQILQMLVAGKPVTRQQTDQLRHSVVQAIRAANPSLNPAANTNLNFYCGDVHCHTYYSDGIASPPCRVLQAIHLGMDFLVITDHNTIDGARLAARLAVANKLDFPVIIGEEITTWAHMNAYPLKELVNWKAEGYEIVESARRQGAAITWNHPEWLFPDRCGAAWLKQILEEGWHGTGLDAWEHATVPDYYARKKAGTLPTMVGASDSHMEEFFRYFHSERTLIWAPSPQGDDVAGAIRRGRALLIAPGQPDLFYGSAEMCVRAIAALADDQLWPEQSAAAVRKALGQADIPALLRQSPPDIVLVDED